LRDFICEAEEFIRIGAIRDVTLVRACTGRLRCKSMHPKCEWQDNHEKTYESSCSKLRHLFSWESLSDQSLL